MLKKAKAERGFYALWLLANRPYLIFFLGVLALFILIGVVFAFQKSVMLYLSFLIFVFGSICFGFAYYKDYLNYRYLKEKSEGDFQGGSPSECYLLALLETQKAKEKEIRENAYLQRQALIDYYTLWAHQIKTPIAAAKLLVGDMVASQEMRMLLQELFKIEQYVELVMSYLRMDDFHKDLSLKEENIGELVRQTVKKYALFFMDGKVSLFLGNLEGTIITDKKWFSVILEQILSNAVKYTKEGKIEIYLSEEALFIKDTGIGIQKSDLSRVFERGFSGFNGRLDQRASGLGLYLSREIAKQLSIDLFLTSDLGKGTVVKLIFKKDQVPIFE